MPALLVGKLAHAAHHDPEVVEHALRHRNELLTGRRHLNAPRRSLEDAHPKHILNPLDGPSEGWLRSSQLSRGGNKAFVFCDGKDRRKLSRTQIRRMHLVDDTHANIG